MNTHTHTHIYMYIVHFEIMSNLMYTLETIEQGLRAGFMIFGLEVY